MTIRPDRRHVLAGLAAAGLLGPGLARAAEDRPTGDIVLGAEDAPVTVIEYASFTCPHCADFHRDTMPKVKSDYIDSGRVKFILREVYFDPYGLWASMIARCGGREAFYPISESLMRRQDDWTRADDPAAALQKIGRVNGLGSEAMRACLQDRDFAEALVARYKETAEADGIESTPSFVIDGEVHRGNMGFEDFSALLDAALDGAS